MKIFAAVALALSVSVVAQENKNRFNNIHRGQRGSNNNNNNNNNNSGSQAGASNSTSIAATSTSNPATVTATGVSNATAATTGVSNATATTSGLSNATATATGASNATATAGAADSGNPQTSLTLDPNVIATGFASDGQQVPAAGQVASLTSTNNFINFCLTVSNLPLTNGKQIATGSCNPAPMGVIPSSSNMPSAKFTFPKNGDTSIAANTPFTISMAIQNLESGNFVNADSNYFSAPQQVNGQGQIIGHSHVVVETLSSLDQTTPLDPQKFAFFKGLNDVAVNGVLTADVTSGLPAGFYKLSSINTAANHQPVLVPIAQHGSLDDAVYFTVGSGGGGNGTTASATAVANATQSAAPTASSSATNGRRAHARALN